MHPVTPLRERSPGYPPSWRELAPISRDSPPRVVLPELLDELPPDSPAARASRRDLLIINRLLGSTQWFRRTLGEQLRPDEPVLELGAGTGELGLALNAGVPNLAGLDLCGRPIHWPRQASWFKTNVLEFADWAAYPVVIGNLFFHHFDRGGLAKLGAKLNEHARVLITSDPLRALRTRRLFSLLCPLIQAHPVTRYDGRVSIGAGFRQEELPHLLQLDPAVWRWHVQATWLCSCRLVAVRRT